MANKDTLVPGGYKLSRDEASKGGKNSVESRRKKKQLREILEILMERNAGKDREGNDITTAEAMAIKAVKEAMNGDWKAWELVRDTSGQKPIEKVMIADVDQSIIDEVERMVLNDDN